MLQIFPIKDPNSKDVLGTYVPSGRNTIREFGNEAAHPDSFLTSVHSAMKIVRETIGIQGNDAKALEDFASRIVKMEPVPLTYTKTREDEERLGDNSYQNVKPSQFFRADVVRVISTPNSPNTPRTPQRSGGSTPSRRGEATSGRGRGAYSR